MLKTLIELSLGLFRYQKYPYQSIKTIQKQTKSTQYLKTQDKSILYRVVFFCSAYFLKTPKSISMIFEKIKQRGAMQISSPKILNGSIKPWNAYFIIFRFLLFEYFCDFFKKKIIFKLRIFFYFWILTLKKYNYSLHLNYETN